MSNILEFRPRERPKTTPISQYETDLVFDILAFCQDHGINCGFEFAISMAACMADGFVERLTFPVEESCQPAPRSTT